MAEALKNREERRSPRFFYERGALEILSPSAEHDMTSRIVATLIELLAEEADTDVESSGSTTFKREDLARGFEPDECFYFGGNASRVRDTVAGKGNIELDAGDPAPDLVVEVYITSPSFDKLSIYARLGVHEVWRYAETPDGWRSSGWRTSAKAAKSRVTPKRRRAPTCRGSP